MDTGPYSGSASGSMTLTKIPRYASITSFSEKSKTLNTITIQYSVDSNIDSIQYMFEGGSWTNLPSSNTITGLNDNTAYKIRIRVKRTDSQLWTESNYITITTYKRATFLNVPNVNIGSSQTITWENPSGATTTLVLYRTDGTTVINNFGTVTGTSRTYTAPVNTIYQLTPNSNTYTAKYKITTTQNGISYTNEKSFNFIVTNSNPIFSNFEYEDTNTDSSTGTVRLTNDNTVLIKNYSRVKAIISTSNKAQAQNYATMNNYKFIIGTQTPIVVSYSDSSTVELGTLVATDNILDVYAIDSRGNSGNPVRKTLEVGTKFINYEDLKITSVTATRDNGGAGETVTLNIQGTFWNNTFGTNASAITNHIKSIVYEYKEASASNWITGSTTITATESGSSYSFQGNVSGDLGASGFDVSKSFNIRITIKDELSTKTYTLTLGAGTPAIAINSNNGVAIGQKYDTSLGGALQVKGNAKVSGDVTVNNNNISVVAMNNELKKHLILKHGPAYTSGTEYILLGSLNYTDSSTDNATFIRINGTLGTWSTFANIDMVIRNRGGLRVDGTYTGQNGAFSTNTIVIYKESNNTYKIYLKLTGWYGASDLELSTNQGSISNSTTRVTPTGTLVKTLNASTLGLVCTIGGTELYRNDVGTTGTVTLSESAANFSFLEIYYGKKSEANNQINNSSVKVYSPNGKMADLFLMNRATSDIIQIISSSVIISGTSITKNYNFSVNFYNDGTRAGGSISDNTIIIYKVDGYR